MKSGKEKNWAEVKKVLNIDVLYIRLEEKLRRKYKNKLKFI